MVSSIQAICSGFQTGADMGGILAAVELDIPTGGYMPKGWKTERGPKPEYEDLYGAMESEDKDYKFRTRQNVEVADATVIFGRRSPGSNATEGFCHKLERPVCWVHWPTPKPFTSYYRDGCPTFLVHADNWIAVRMWIKRKNFRIVNVAGNRESVNLGIEEFTKSFLVKALR